jgi:hypothetical protein
VNVTDGEILEELEHRVDAGSLVPFTTEEGALVGRLSFASRPLTRETCKDAWTNFLKEAGREHLGWPAHFGIAVWYWEHEMRLHAAAVFEHLHRDVRRGYDQIGEVAGYQADYLPRMLQLYAELSDSERVSQLFGRLEELYEDGHVAISEYSDGLLAAIGTVGERSTDGHSLLHSATRTISDLRERLDSERREKEALKAEVDAGVRFKDTCSEAEKDLGVRYASSFPTFCPQTQQFLIEASSWNTTPFRNINPCWSPILYQKAIEYEFNEIVWAPFRRIEMPLPPEFRHERLTINQIYRLFHSAEPLIKGIARSVSERLRIKFALSPLQATALQKLKDHCNRARHGDRKPYTPADLDACMRAITEGEAIVQILDLFRPR